MKNATMLYKVPGPHETNGGVTFDYIVVDEDEIPTFERKGWCKTLDEAGGKKSKRTELEKEAEGLKLQFDGRTSDAKLETMIKEAKESKKPLYERNLNELD